MECRLGAARKGFILKQRSRAATLKVAILSALAAVAALAAFGPGLATGAYPGENTAGPTTSSIPTVYIELDKHNLHFVAPKTIVAGEQLQVVNKTNPKQVGPHTFSLVTKSSIPKTKKARQLCFTPHHICKAIASWHGFKKGKITINPAEAGAEGWDTLGSVSKKGDSWFTGEKPGTSVVQQLTADTSAGPTTIYFMCAVHAWMHGSIEVLPASS